ncbi:hypothetical protein [Gottfriedia solisilvae]|uniref:hypothetical protein n=1 Tax=Gottfriedia solisilvae TaxID=1516104 RepID=UPI003D2F3467
MIFKSRFIAVAEVILLAVVTIILTLYVDVALAGATSTCVEANGKRWVPALEEDLLNALVSIKVASLYNLISNTICQFAVVAISTANA